MQRKSDCLQLNWLGKSTSHKTYVGHRKYWEDILKSLQLNITQTDRCKVIEWDRQYTMDLTNLKGYHHPEITDINIYTDGSKTKEHTGAGYVIFKRKAE